MEPIIDNHNNQVTLSGAQLILIVLSTVLVNIGDRLSNVIICSVACIIPLIIAVFNSQKAAPVILMTFLNNKAFSIAGIGLYTLIITLIIAKDIVLSNRYKNSFVLPLCYLFLLVYGSVQCIICTDLAFFSTSYVKVVLVLLFFKKLFDENKDNIYDLWKRLVFYLVIGLTVSSLIAIFVNPLLLSESRLSLSEAGGENFAGIQVAIGAVYALIMFISKEYKHYRPLFFICFVTLTIIGILTGSKTFFLVFAIGVVLISVLSILSLSPTVAMRMIVFCVLILIGAFIIIKNSPKIENSILYLFNRFINPKNNDISTGRFEIWDTYFQVFRDNPLYFIFGVGSYSNIGLHKMAHNMLIEMICGYGIIGSIIFMIAYFKTGLCSRFLSDKDGRLFQKMMGAVPLILVFASGISSHSLASFPSTLQFMLGMASLYCIPISLQM